MSVVSGPSSASCRSIMKVQRRIDNLENFEKVFDCKKLQKEVIWSHDKFANDGRN